MPRIAEVALFTEDVAGQDAEAERAREAEADVVAPRDSYWGRSAYLRDPDGRAVELQPDN